MAKDNNKSKNQWNTSGLFVKNNDIPEPNFDPMHVESYETKNQQESASASHFDYFITATTKQIHITEIQKQAQIDANNTAMTAVKEYHQKMAISYQAAFERYQVEFCHAFAKAFEEKLKEAAQGFDTAICEKAIPVS